MFERSIEGVPLTFHLAGINNQNFLMRDEQTGSYWQQITGRAISGPLRGKTLKLIGADELSFGVWKSEQPNGKVLQDVPSYRHEYAPPDWDVQMAKSPVVISYAQAGIQPRDLMLGISAFGASRAYPYQRVLKEKLIQDHINAEPILLVTAPDDRSVRVFRRGLRDSAAEMQFYLLPSGPGLFLDAETGTHWDFRGCALDGPSKGACLEQVYALKDYWFDWRNYHPDTTVYGVSSKIY